MCSTAPSRWKRRFIIRPLRTERLRRGATSIACLIQGNRKYQSVRHHEDRQRGHWNAWPSQASAQGHWGRRRRDKDHADQQAEPNHLRFWIIAWKIRDQGIQTTSLTFQPQLAGKHWPTRNQLAWEEEQGGESRADRVQAKGQAAAFGLRDHLYLICLMENMGITRPLVSLLSSKRPWPRMRSKCLPCPTYPWMACPCSLRIIRIYCLFRRLVGSSPRRPLRSSKSQSFHAY